MYLVYVVTLDLRRFGAFYELLVREDEPEVLDWDHIMRRVRSVTETIWVLRRKYDSKDQLSKYSVYVVTLDGTPT